MYAILLSNPVHALTVDTAGVVAVWDIVRAVCVGQFAREDVVHAVNAHNNTGGGGSTSHPQGEEKAYVCSPRHALDIVRERIDEVAFVVLWSFVDTSMGVLNVLTSTLLMRSFMRTSSVFFQTVRCRPV